MLKGFLIDIKEWILDTAKVVRREFGLVFSSPGTLLFFFALPLAYPIVYALIYNTEVTRNMPVAVVDNCRTADSREFVRHADATQAIEICGYAANMAEAKRWWEEKKCYAILEIPQDYSKRTYRGEQGVINFYSDMSLLLRYRTFLESLTSLQMETDAELRTMAVNTLGVGGMVSGGSVETESYFLGDPEQGFASFILPGIVVLILQQSMMLGITFLCGASDERKRKYGGVDPYAIQASPSATVIGKMLCYVILYIPLCIYILHYIPMWFAFPHIGDIFDAILFMLPLLIASAMLGQTLQVMVSERESAFIVVVFTSVAFLFLSGLTWPRYAMPDLWKVVSDMIPSTWGVEGFIRINNNGATLAQESVAYHWLWGLSLAYFVTAYFITRWKNRVLPASATVNKVK